MKRLRALFLWRDTRGAIAPIVAVMAAVLVASTALALEVGAYYVGSRNLRSATEAAALAAAVSLGRSVDDAAQARQRAIEVLKQNGYTDANILKPIELGRYCADISLAATARFVPIGSTVCPGNGHSTAVRLNTVLAGRQFFGLIFGEHSPIPQISASATAARIDEAGLGLTTGVLGLSGLTASVLKLVNTILTQLAGLSINLNEAELSALLGTNVDAATFFHALAAGNDTQTYGQIANKTVPLSTLISAAQTASVGTPSAGLASALANLSGAAGSVQVPLAGLFDLGVWEKMPIGDANEPQNLKAGLNAYQLITYALQAHNGGLNITVSGASLDMPTIAQVQLIDSWQGQVARARFAFGPQGETQVNTSALRLKLTLKVSNLGTILDGIGLSVLNKLALAPIMSTLNLLTTEVPLLIDIGTGSAKLSSISCGQESTTDAQVGVTAKSGLLYLYLGSPPANAMSTTMPPITADDIGMFDLVPDLLNLHLLNVKMRATLGPVAGSGGSVPLNFTQTGSVAVIGHPPLPGKGARVLNTMQLAPQFSSLGNSLQISACLLGSCTPTNSLVNGLITNVGTLVGGLLNALGVDGLVDSLLAALGIQPGFSDVWVTGVRCGVPVLV